MGYLKRKKKRITRVHSLFFRKSELNLASSLLMQFSVEFKYILVTMNVPKYCVDIGSRCARRPFMRPQHGRRQCYFANVDDEPFKGVFFLFVLRLMMRSVCAHINRPLMVDQKSYKYTFAYAFSLYMD